jgi:hypothetical protein
VDGAPETGPSTIAGIEMGKAEDIFERNHWWLMSIPGVTGVALTAGGIRVEIQTTEGVCLIPNEIEGLPVFTVPYVERHHLSHTIINRLPVEHAGALVIDKAENGATLGAAVLSHGETWWTLPTHLLRFNNLCGNSPPPPLCPFGTPLWQCNRYPGVEFVYQPTAPGPIPANIIGHVTTWDPNWQYPPPTKPTTTDIAAAFADNNTIRRDGSLPVDNQLESYGTLQGFANPVMNEKVIVVTGGLSPDGMHLKHGTINATNARGCDFVLM